MPNILLKLQDEFLILGPQLSKLLTWLSLLEVLFFLSEIYLTNFTRLENKVENASVKGYLSLSISKENICFIIAVHNVIFIFLRKLGFVS